MLNALPGTPESILEVCNSHLVRPLPDFLERTLHPDWFLDLHFSHIVEKGEQRQHLDVIEKSLRAALNALNHLHSDVRRSLEHQASANLRNDKPIHRLATFVEIDDQSQPIETFDNIRTFIIASLAAYVGQPSGAAKLESSPNDKTKSAKFAALEALSEYNMLDKSPQARVGETWQKALMVKRCRQLWEIGHDEPAPKSFSGPFGSFLTDMVEALGKADKWSNPETVMNSWRDRASLDPWFL